MQVPLILQEVESDLTVLSTNNGIDHESDLTWRGFVQRQTWQLSLRAYPKSETAVQLLRREATSLPDSGCATAQTPRHPMVRLHQSRLRFSSPWSKESRESWTPATQVSLGRLYPGHQESIESLGSVNPGLHWPRSVKKTVGH